MTATTLHAEYDGKSQSEIMGEICRMTDQLTAARRQLAKKKSYGAAGEVQRITRQRSELQALLTKPQIVRSA